MTGAGQRWSLKRTLLASLLGLTLLLWASSAAIVYVEAQQESDELFDQSLVETAHLLLSLVENEVREHGLSRPISLPMQGHANPRRYLLFQVRDVNGRVLYKNDGAPDAALAPDAPAGLAWTTLHGQRWRLYSLWDERRELALVVAEPTSHREDISSRFFYKIVIFGTLMALLAAAALWWSISRVVRVLQDSADEVAARTPNDLAEVSVDAAPSEVHPLLLAINRLFARVRQTIEHEQRFTADAAHELRTPLAAIKTNLQVLQRARTADERDEFTAALGASVDRAARLMDQLLTLEKVEGAVTPRQPADLAPLLREQADHWRQQCAAHGLALACTIHAAPCQLHGDSMHTLLRNLVDNAVRYTPAPGRIAISCGQRDGATFVCVADSGPGIPAAMQARVFERFFRLAGAATPGSGLGLSIVARIAEQHHAKIELGAGLDGRGLSVTVRFP
ncbi:histidine kinase [Duganella sp. Leaf126]|uniref:sensor histidine kinase n=1 Tax=Duganella sp. Leaf126 TaxID=1736266 RepID=UPI0007005836|nr:ATP-binding protein [Duganella sp. Leaf126]KQQ40070.1 histidine kinase [Duganella sp. Leaf126]